MIGWAGPREGLGHPHPMVSGDTNSPWGKKWGHYRRRMWVRRVSRGCREGGVLLPASDSAVPSYPFQMVPVPVIKNLITRCACAQRKLICLIGSSLALSCSFSF